MKYPPANTLLSLYRHSGPQTSHRLGQNFLTDEDLLARIADATFSDAKTLAIEIGPGPATLTALLAERAGAVVAIEFDRRQEEYHRKIFSTDPNVEFLYQDALRTNLHALADEQCAKRNLSRRIITGNLPFQITSPLLFDQCGPGRSWDRMVFMVQKEVADRITARPNGKDYGILTIKLGFWWSIAERFEVPAAKFRPQPKVDAAVLVFEPIPAELHPSLDIWPGLSRFVDAAFNQRRKKLYNSLSERWRGASRDVIQAAMAATNLDANARAENLSIADFVRLFSTLEAVSPSQPRDPAKH